MAAVIVLAVLCLPLLSGLTYYGLDLTRIDLGILCAFQRQLAEGSGLWLSPTLGHGGAFFARPEVGLLYPPRWVALALPPDVGASWGAIFHLAVAAASTAWLARTFRLRPWIAVGTGLCFAFSGTALDLILHSHYIVAAAWLPLAWASTRRMLTPRGRGAHTVVVGVALALCLLGGEPQAFAIASALACLEAGRHLWRWRRRALVSGLQIGLVIGAAFAIGMAQWASTLAELQLTERTYVLSSTSMMNWSFSPVTWPGVLWPGWVHEPSWPAVSIWHIWNQDITQTFPWNRQPYVGSLFVALAACGLFCRRARLPATVMTVAVLLALGDYTPLLPALTEIFPPLGLFRYPAKYLVVATVAAVLVVGIFVQTLTRARRARRQLLLAGVVLLAGQAVVLVTIYLTADSLERIAAAMLTPVLREDDLPHLATVMGTAIGQSMVPLAIALSILAWVPKLRGTVLGLVVVDLLLATPSTLLLGPTLEDLRSPMVRVGDEDTVMCVEPDLAFAEFQSRVFSRWGTYSYLRGLPFPELNACDGLANPILYSPLTATMTRRLERGLAHGRAAAARALGCTTMISRTPPIDGTVDTVAADEPWWRAYEEAYRARIYRIHDPLPTAFAPREPRLVTGYEENVVNALGQTRDAHGAIGVIDDPLNRLAEHLPDGLGVTSVDVDWPVRHSATLTAHGEGGAVLGLRTAFHVGWSAHQGDDQLPVVRIGGQHVGAVVADVGRGPVTFEYAPPRLGLGLLLAALGALALVGCALWRRRSFLANPRRIGHDRAESGVVGDR